MIDNGFRKYRGSRSSRTIAINVECEDVTPACHLCATHSERTRRNRHCPSSGSANITCVMPSSAIVSIKASH
jgi:hypothetical protein